MAILIDGYNLLHVLGFVGSPTAPGALQRARTRLIERLAACLDADERPRTTIVFDAAEAPAGLPHELRIQGLLVRYAVGYEDADTLLEELIRSDATPQRLTVVSSDHRVQQAARRRRAIAVDSEAWLDSLVSRRLTQQQSAPDALKPDLPLTAAEVAAWLLEFGTGLQDDVGSATQKAAVRAKVETESLPLKPGEASAEDADLSNPCPAGYLDDLPEDID